MDPQVVVQTLSALDDNLLSTVLAQLLQLKPELAPALVALAVPDLTYCSSKAFTEKRCSGRLKKLSPELGLGFIDCPELNAVFGGDVIVKPPQVGSFLEGQQVTFAVMLNEETKPQAFDLLDKSGNPSRSSLAGCGGGCGCGGCGCGSCGCAGMGGCGMGDGGMGGCSMGMGCGGSGMGMGGSGCSMGKGGSGCGMGIGGCGCGCGMGMGDGGCGTGMGMDMGSSGCSMSMGGDMGGKGKMRQEWDDRYGGGMGGGMGDGMGGGMCGPDMAGGGKGGPPPAVNQEILGEFYGIIKSYNPEKGFGFIVSDALKSQHEGDVFLHSKYISNFVVGQEVKFQAFLHNGRLQGRELQDASGVVGVQSGVVPGGQDEQELGVFVGKLKEFKQDKGFGFILCEALSTQGYQGDVFVHGRYVGNFVPGNDVSFMAVLKNGKLQARDLQPAETVMDGMNNVMNNMESPEKKQKTI